MLRLMYYKKQTLMYWFMSKKILKKNEEKVSI